MDEEEIIAGFARRSIVFEDAVLLATCRGRRDGRTRDVSDYPPEVNVLICEIDGRAKVTIGLDLAWIDQPFCRELRALLIKRFESVRADEIFISAIHTHSAPQVVAGIGHYGEVDESAREFILQTAADCVGEALGNMSGWQAISPRVFEHDLPIINRKKRGLSGKWFPGANAKRYSPSIGRATALKSRSGEIGFVMVQLACHPVFEKRNRQCADFPGVMRRSLREKFGDSTTVLFLQGFSGDIRPDYRSFPSGKELFKQTLRFGWPAPQFTTSIENRIEKFGQDLAGRVIEAISDGADRSSETVRKLPDAQIQSIAVAASGSGRDDSIEVWGFNCLPNVRLIGVSGETFASFGREIDEAAAEDFRASRWPVGLANGLWGYLPDQALVEAKSGYEYTCWKLFGHDGPLADEYVEQLSTAVREVAASAN